MATLPMHDPDAAVTELERVVQAHKSSSGKTEPEIQVSVMKTWQRGLLSACLGGGLAVGGYAQDYPTKPIRMVIPFAPGGANDVIGRLVGMKLTAALGQQVIVDNRGGAGGSIGADLIAKAPPDGYNLLLGNIANLSVNPTLYRKLPYHPLTDFQPITLIAKIPNILAVHPSLPVRSVKDLVALAKAKPGSLVFGTGGSGSGSHLTAEYFKLLAKVDMVHVPYKGVGIKASGARVD